MKLLLTQLSAYSQEFTSNFERVSHLVEPLRSKFDSNDVLLLPERVGDESDRAQYDTFTGDLAGGLGCHVVAGSHHEQRRGATELWRRR